MAFMGWDSWDHAILVGLMLWVGIVSQSHSADGFIIEYFFGLHMFTKNEKRKCVQGPRDRRNPHCHATCIFLCTRLHNSHHRHWL